GDADFALLDQREDGGAGDRFGLRGDAEDRVRSHLAAGFLVAPAYGALVHGLSVAQNESDGAGDLALVYVFPKDGVQTLEAFGGESPVGGEKRKKRAGDKAAEFCLEKGGWNIPPAILLQAPYKIEFRIHHEEPSCPEDHPFGIGRGRRMP